MAGIFARAHLNEAGFVILNTGFASGQRRAAEAHQFEVGPVRCRLGHSAHPQSGRTGRVTFLADHVAKPVVDGVHCHQPRRCHCVGDDGRGSIGQSSQNIGFDRPRQPLGFQEVGRRQGDTQGLFGLQVFAAQHA